MSKQQTTPRRKTSRSPLETAHKTLEQCLMGENVDALLAPLSKTERAFLEEMAREIREGGKSEQLEQLWKLDYVSRPPSIDDFITDPYWLGAVTLPTRENPGLWPTWREILIRDFDLDSRIHNCVITGSLGIGKTWNMVLILLYRLTLASLLRNPHNFVGLAAGSKIVYVLMSVTKAQVQDTAFGEAMNMMGKSPYFLEELHFDPDCRYSGQVIDLGRGIQLNAGSKSQHIIGRNTLGIGMDEGNFRLESNPNVKAFKLFNDVRTRIKNRFQKVSGFLPAISIIASSASDESSFTETVIAEIVKKGDPKTEIVYSNPVYYMKNRTVWAKLGASKDIIDQHANRFRPRWFKVAYGLKNVTPSILGGWFDEHGNKFGPEEHESPPIGSRTELIPEDYHAEYERDIVGALQSLSGISIGGSYRLFTSTVDIEWCIAEGERMGLINPCTVEQIPLSEEDDREIWDFLDHPTFLLRQGGVIKPKRHPSALRYAHMDLATRSMAGLSICHKIGSTEVQDAVDRKTGSVFADHRIIVEYDFILTVVAGRAKPISFEKIQKLFIWLREKCGYSFGLITADTFQSFMQLQMLETRDFPTGSLSMDRKKDGYYAFRSGIEERRVRMFRQNWFCAEAEKLVDGSKMVDHVNEGDVTSKDTCLRGDTRVRLANGSWTIIKQLCMRRAHSRQILAYDETTGKQVIAPAYNGRITGWVHRWLRVQLNTRVNSYIFCTPEHRFLLADKTWRKAIELTPGTQLMPLQEGQYIVVKAIVWTMHKDKPEPAYDITVKDYHNFALRAGVYAHNCDAVAGSYFNCVNNQAATDSSDIPSIVPNSDLEHMVVQDKAPITIEIPPWRRTTRRFISK